MTFSEIAEKLDTAVIEVEKRQDIVAKAKNALTAAEIACGEAVNSVREIHAEYQKRIASVVTLGGTVHK